MLRKHIFFMVLGLFLLFTVSCAKEIEKETISVETTQATLTEPIKDKGGEQTNFDFENCQEPPLVWSAFGSGFLTIEENGQQGNCLVLKERENEWTTPALNLYDVVKESGEGLYTIRYWIALVSDMAENTPVNFGTLIRGGSKKDANSFIAEQDGNTYFRMENVSFPYKKGEWYEIARSVYIDKQDFDGEDHVWNLCLDMLSTDIKEIKVDNVTIMKEVQKEVKEKIPTKADQWVMAEMVVLSDISYANPLEDAMVDIRLTHTESGMVVTIPGFWDGNDVWKFRFALPKTGEWQYQTQCSDTANIKLNGLTGKVECTAYQGELAIYQHGFIKTDATQRCFMYQDGTPFFYLGDTHWNMPVEEFDDGGSRVKPNSTIASHFCYIVDERIKQGFTVYQSEPIGAKYTLHDGLSQADIAGFQDLDRRFQYIAEKGLVHANAMLFFTPELANFAEEYNEDYLEKLTRYWVARYGAYPVLWTLAQECDDDFYYDRGDQKVFTAETNPWKKVANWVTKYDAYQSPLSAHQEYASSGTEGGVNATRSAFRNLEGHKWYAIQWSPTLNGKLDYNLTRDYWENGQNKPIVNYEGRYDHLWTKHFGARVQGWTAYLNGMYGYGYGAVDIWLYLSTYNIDVESKDGVDTITPEDKATDWTTSVDFISAYQVGYMRQFFEKLEWWKLTPRFDDKKWAELDEAASYSIASDENKQYVIYFYNRSTKTGVVHQLDNGEYSFVWFNPRENTYSESMTIQPENGSYTIGEKPDKEDWVLLLTKKA